MDCSRMGRSELIDSLRQARELIAAARPVDWAIATDLEAAHAWQRKAAALLGPEYRSPEPPDAA